MREKDGELEKDYSPNPAYNEPIREHPEAERTRLYEYHKIAGSLETYYDMYPLDRPPSRDRER